MTVYLFRNVLGFELDENAEALLHDLMDHQTHWSNRDTIIRRLGWIRGGTNNARLDAYTKFACAYVAANTALARFGFEIRRHAESENYRLMEKD